MKKALKFISEYRIFSLAVVAIIIGLGLLLAGQKSASNLVIAVVAAVELIPLLWNMWKDFRNGRYGIDILAATAIIASLLLKEYWAAIVIVLMLTGGEALEKYAENRAKSELKSLLKNAPQKANLLRKGKIVEVKVDEIKVGDKIFIRAGELVAVDATVIEGAANFDESSLTGESIPEPKAKGDSLLSGSLNIDGAVTAKATATAKDSQYQQIIKLVSSASASKAPFVRLADRYSIPFTILAYAIACGVWAISGEAIRFLEVIVVATPCPLLLAAPIALISGMSRASSKGIIVKSGTALERLAEAKSMAFDKTGTLTSGNLAVEGVTVFGDFDQDTVLGIAASLEQNSGHILAHAIVTAARHKNIKFKKAKHVSEINGRGLSATIKRQEIIVGRFSLIEESGVSLPRSFKPETVQKTAVYVAVDGTLAGYISLEDQVRDETPSTLRSIYEMGIKNILMITGDNEAVASKVSSELGISQFHADALPADKLHIMERVKQRPIVFVGDGVNDAPILTAADVGIALGARGSTAASESADIVIMLDNFGRVATALAIAKRTFYIARQSILIGIGLSIGLMLIFATGKFTPLAGAIVQEVVDVFVIINALRAHTGKLEA